MSHMKYIDRILLIEGGYQSMYQDRGNWDSGIIGQGNLNGTKYGISSKAYPNLDIINITEEDAIAIYKRDYWDKIWLDKILDTSPALAFQMLDFGVHSGIRASVKNLQITLNDYLRAGDRIADDGVMGRLTYGALSLYNECEMDVFAINYLKRRLSFLTNIKNWNNYSRGFANRVCKCMSYLAEDMLDE